MREILSRTESVCPECLARIPADRVSDGADIFLEKTCPEHGAFRTVLWRGKPYYALWARPKIPSFPQNPFTEVRDGCPYDCGLCGDHRQHTCSVLLEVTQRCDLRCPVCFADAGKSSADDWTLSEVSAWYDRLLACGGPFNIQFSGGEPCLRDDLPEMIRLGRAKGFSFFQVNTNGLRIACEPAYLAKLKDAGLTTVFLQFDGTNDAIYRQIRGRDLLEQKLQALANCVEQGVGVVLVPTLIPGINTGDIGNIIRLALANMPAARGVHFQPVSYFGRYPAGLDQEARITLPEVIREIETQTGGMMPAESFCPPGCENALCSFHANFVLMPNGVLKPLSHFQETTCGCKPIIAAEGAARARKFVSANWANPGSAPQTSIFHQRPSLDDLDFFLERKRTYTFCISGMAFQDAWNLDLERLRDCCIHVASPDGRLVPFCAYNLTDRQGRSIYRNHQAG